jgi:hypothetical protein
MCDHHQVVFELCRVRAQNEYLEQDLSVALHLFYVMLGWIFTTTPPEQAERLRGLVHAKILQLPQGCRIGQQLIKLDEQFGGTLEMHGVWLSRWVYESRVKPDD